MTSYVKMKNRTDQWYQLGGAFAEIGTSAAASSVYMNRFMCNYTTTSNNSVKWTTTSGTSSSTDQWIYVYDNPPHAQTKPVRRLGPREFNKYVNGSDLLEEFIAFLGTEGVRQGDVMALPLELFIKWLIIRACEQDQEEPPVVLELPARKSQPRCLGCQRFMRNDTTLPLHGAQCADRHFARAA